MNTDERRALKILQDKKPEDETLHERFMKYLSETHSHNERPEAIAKGFELWEWNRAQTVMWNERKT